MLDLANPEEKERLRADISLDHRLRQSVTIINPNSLLKESTRTIATAGGISVTEQTPQTNPLEALRPDIKHIFIDEVNKYAGNPQQRGRAKLIVDLLRRTNSTQANPTEIYGVSSTPKVSREEEGQASSETHNQIDFTQLFPQNHVIKGINYGELKQQGFIRNIELQGLQVATNDLKPNQYGQLFQCTHDDDGITRVECSSALVKLTEIINSHNKTRIMTHTARAADDLAKILCIQGHRASTVSSYHKGHYELVNNPSEDQVPNLETVIIGHTPHYLRRVTKDEHEILNSFEADPNNNIIIDYQILNGHNSPKVDTLIFFNGSDWEPKMLRALGQSACGTSSNKPLTVMHCEFSNDVNGVGQSIQTKLNDLLTDPAPWWREPNSVTTSTTTGPPISSPKAPVAGELGLSSTAHTAGLQEHRAWMQEGLEPIYQYLTNKKEQYLTQIKNHFKKQEKSLDLDVLYGRKKDPEHFSEIIAYNQKLLARLFPGHHIYSNPNAYQIHVASIAPSLVKLDVKSDDFAKELVESLYQKNNSNPENNSTENKVWLAALDQALNIHPQANDLTRIHYRSKKFAEVLYHLYGPEFFCFPTNVTAALQVFTGQTRNKFLLTYLAQSCIPNASELEKLKTQFPGMFATNSSRSFADLKASILGKYSEPPNPDDTKKFFTQTLYKDLNIDLASLINAAVLATQDSGQSIKTQADLRSDIDQFLQKVEANLFTQERSLINDGGQYQRDIQELVNRHLEPITQEILFNQLTHKIWEHAAIRSSTTSSDHRLSTMSPDTLTTEALGIKANTQYEAIDLLSANKSWLEFITQATDSMVDLEALSGLKIGTKARLMTAIDKFATQKSLTPLSAAVLNLLCGIESPANNADRELIRNFISFIGKDISEAVSRFPDRLGVLDLSEANLVVKRSLSEINISEFNKRLAKLTNNATTNPELIAEFLFTRDPDALLDPEALDSAIKLINGEARGQGYLRSYISFLESKGLVKLIDIIVALPKLTGLHDKDELIAAMKAPERFNLPEAIQKPSNSNTIKKVGALSESLGLSIDKMAGLLGVPDPELFYREPIKLINIASNTSPPLTDDQKIFTTIERTAILSREIIKAAFRERYHNDKTHEEIPTVFTKAHNPLIAIDSGATTSTIDSSTSQPSRINRFYSNQVTAQHLITRRHALTVVEDYNTKYQNDEWSPVTLNNTLKMDPQLVRGFVQTRQQKNPTWFTKLTTHCDRGPEAILNTLLKFRDTLLTQETYAQLAEFNALIAIAFGNEETIKQDPNNQEIFRQWVQFIGMNLDEVIAEFPKLTGVRDFREMQLFIDQNYSPEKLDTLNLNPTDPGALNKLIRNQAIPESGLSIETIAKFPECKELIDKYIQGIETNELCKQSDLMRLINQPAMYKSLLATIIAFKLFPNQADSFSVPLYFYTSEEEQRKQTSYVQLDLYNNILECREIRSSEIQAHSVSRSKSQSNSWIQRTYSENYLAHINAIRNGILQGNHALIKVFKDAISKSEGFIIHEEGWELGELMDDYLKNINSSDLAINSASIIGDKNVFGKDVSTEIKQNGLKILRSFIDFATERHSAFGKITDDVLKSILTIQDNSTEAIDLLESLKQQQFVSTLQQTNSVEEFNEKLSSLAKNNKLTAEQLFEALGLNFIINQDGTLNALWLNKLVTQIVASTHNKGIAPWRVHGPTLISLIIQATISQKAEPPTLIRTIMDMPNNPGWSLAATSEELIVLSTDPDTNKETVHGRIKLRDVVSADENQPNNQLVIIENIKAAILAKYPTLKEAKEALLTEERKMKAFLLEIQREFDIDQDKLMRIFNVTTPTQFATLSEPISQACYAAMRVTEPTKITAKALNEKYLKWTNETRTQQIIGSQILEQVYPSLNGQVPGLFFTLGIKDLPINYVLAFQQGQISLIQRAGEATTGDFIVRYNLQADGSWK